MKTPHRGARRPSKASASPRIPTRHGWFPSFKSGRPLLWRSSIELDFLRFAEVCPDIRGIGPVTTALPPSLRLPRRSVRWQGFYQRAATLFVLTREPCNPGPDTEVIARSIGLGISFFSADYFRAEPRSITVSRLLATLGHEPEPWSVAVLLGAVASGPLHLVDLVALLDHPEAARDVLALCRDGRLRVDLHLPITSDTEIRLGGEHD